MDPRSPRPRIEDVAHAAGVSKTAVSFAFNSPERLATETVARIQEVASSLGYRPHPIARLLNQGRTMTLGLLAPQPLAAMFANPFFALFSEGVAEAAETDGYGLHFLSPLHGSLALAVDRSTVDGVVALGLSASHPEVEQIRRAGLAMVLVDADDLPEHGSVVVEDEAGARAAAEHVVALGHREILVLAVEDPMSPGARSGVDGVSERRLRGYRAAFGAAGLDLPADHVIPTQASIDGGRASVEAAWARGLRPTAVLAMSDATAVGVLRAARAAGRAVPGDVSVVGFDDVDLAADVDPPLTTVHQPIRRKGLEAVRILLGTIAEPGAPNPERLRLQTRLVIRGSTGPAPRA